MPESMLAVGAELLDLMVLMVLMETQLLLVSLAHLDQMLIRLLVTVELLVQLVKLDPMVVLEQMAPLVATVVKDQKVQEVTLDNLDNLDPMVSRDNHLEREHSLSVEGPKEVEEREERVIEVGQNHAVVLDRSGAVISQ